MQWNIAARDGQERILETRPLANWEFGMNETGGLLPPKVFGIGFQKTGTSSLGRALEHLGYRVISGGLRIGQPISRDSILQNAVPVLEKYDAVEDTPWPLIYRQLDGLAPGSKFVLTVRDPQRWLKSILSHFAEISSPMHEWIYGHACPTGHEDDYLEKYLQHNELEYAYFADRPGDLLVMDFEKGDGWELLCDFLGKPAPGKRFPKKNTESDRKIRAFRRKVMNVIRLRGFTS